MLQIIKPAWPAPPNIIAGVSTRTGGVSLPPYSQLNLASHVGDEPSLVQENRQRLDQHCRKFLNRNSQLLWHWLEQTHSTDVIEATPENFGDTPMADASFTSTANQACVVLTADCLPVLLTNRTGSVAAAIHAGWRGLCNGIIQSTVEAICVEKIAPKELFAWLGPAIGPHSFEVGDDVRNLFLTSGLAAAHSTDAVASAFTPGEPEKYLCDLYHLATLALTAAGVKQIYGGGFDTLQQSGSFYSYRRDGTTGRLASFIFISPD